MKKELNVKIPKFIQILMIALLLFLVSCKKDYTTEPEYRSEGIIIGVDARKCMCCGGWYIKIKNDTLRFGNLPPQSNVNLQNESFPLNVRLVWKIDPNACLGDEIIILNIEKK